MVMEYVEGTNLDDLLKQHKSLPAEFIVPVFVQALEGLQHAHRKNIFHRDIKPSNIMLTPDGVVKLMDFGIAKVAGEQKMTQVNKIVGTVEFMAPELIQEEMLPTRRISMPRGSPCTRCFPVNCPSKAIRIST